MENLFSPGMQVIKSPFLPIEVTYPACDIETRSEFKIMSDDKIEVVEIDNKLLVSEKVYNTLLK